MSSTLRLAPSSPTRTWATIAALYLAQSVPSYLLIMAVPAALRASGMSLTQVGLLSVLMLPLTTLPISVCLFLIFGVG